MNSQAKYCSSHFQTFRVSPKENLRSSRRRHLLSLRLGRRISRCSWGIRWRSSRRFLGRLTRRSRGLSIVAVAARPQGEVVAQQLHDEGAVTVRLLGERVELGDGVVEGLLGQVAGAIGRVEDLVVEDGEVEGETEADWVGWGQLGLCDVGGALWCFD